MRCRSLIVILFSLLALCLSTRGLATRARASFGVTLTVIAACTTEVDDISGNVNEHCSYPRPYRIDISHSQPAPKTERVTQSICNDTAPRAVSVRKGSNCGAGHDVGDITVYY